MQAKQRGIGLVWVAFLILLCVSLASFGQSFTGDARRIGMGGSGENQNIGSQMIEQQRQYRSVVIPLGLIQVIRDRRYFNPDDDDFNPVRALEDIANPLHITTRRGAGTQRFVNDLVNATFNRDLNSYRGFVPASEVHAEGLASPSFGHVFRFKATPDGRFNGIYVGEGPYISGKTILNVDDQLREFLASSQDVRAINKSFSVTDQSAGQAAAAITLGYRGRLALPGRYGEQNQRNGIYLGANYHYLRGFRYDSADLQLRFDTDFTGLITVFPTTTPLTVDHTYSKKGNGFALDLGVGAVVDRWQFGFGVNGLANRITWDELRLERHSLQSLFNGGEFVRQPLQSGISSARVELPVDTNGDVQYNADSWAALVQVGHGFQGTNFHGGVEKRVGPIELRGGARFARDLWHPAAGIGFNLSKRFAIDAAAFETTSNVQRDRKASYAVSLRFNREPKEN
jgi:hypothetical protein